LTLRSDLTPRRPFAGRFMKLGCVLCGRTTGRVVWTMGEWSVVRCGTCGLLATRPIPESDLLRRIYDNPAYYDTRSDASSDAWTQRAHDILRELPARPGAVLDFGAGEGNLVAALRALGVHAEGVEPSAAGRAAAARVHRIVLHSQAPVAAEDRFDAATLLHSLEHVPEPVHALRQIRSLLTADGFVFIEVPHAGSADLLLVSQRRAILDLPVHLHHFTPRTLERVAAAAGFACIGLKLYNCTAIERALALRAAARTHECGCGAPRSRSAEVREEHGPRTQSVWRRVLATVRETLPGPHFQWIGRAV
jgi:SAM-dependent methyltransferase